MYETSTTQQEAAGCDAANYLQPAKVPATPLALKFARPSAYGFRLNIASGTAVRFEPGQARTVELVALAGDRKVYGFAGRVMGKLKGTGK